MNCSKESLLLYAVTDRYWLNGESLYSQVEKAINGGATFIQLREKNLDEDTYKYQLTMISVKKSGTTYKEIKSNKEC